MGDLFYTKGELNNITSRVNQVHTITIYCPYEDMGVQCLKKSFEMMLSRYKFDDRKWMGVPAVDALNAFIFTSKFHNTIEYPIDMNIVEVITGSLRSFPKLKFINFDFTDDSEILNIYRTTFKMKKKESSRDIFNIEVIEMNLSDMFSQKIIDIINKVMMTNGFISNSYLKRKFKIDFTFDEYISFMDMFLGNNAPRLNMMDNKICDYFRAFPTMVDKHRPNIRIITNYTNL